MAPFERSNIAKKALTAARTTKYAEEDLNRLGYTAVKAKRTILDLEGMFEELKSNITRDDYSTMDPNSEEFWDSMKSEVGENLLASKEKQLLSKPYAVGLKSTAEILVNIVLNCEFDGVEVFPVGGEETEKEKVAGEGKEKEKVVVPRKKGDEYTEEEKQDISKRVARNRADKERIATQFSPTEIVAEFIRK